MAKNLREELKKTAEKAYQDSEHRKMAEEYLKKYGDKDESELMSELLSKVRKNKAQGALSDADLDNFANSVRGFLSPEQQKRMEAIIKTLKSQN
ncbi:MAG: hypothetical protein GX756_04200 [Clostridiales bacterium]|jgi:uncharacterized protein YejL (UPF0352 family)|nr:hypothetical protein [Clostridiales bacterium]